jgi:O-antigen ligase
MFIFFLPFTKFSVPVVGRYEFTVGDLLLLALSSYVMLFQRKILKIYRVYFYTFLIFVLCVSASGVMAKNMQMFSLAILPYAFGVLIIISTLHVFSLGDVTHKLKRLSQVMTASLLLATLPVFYQIVAGSKLDQYYDAYGWRYTFLAQNPNQFGVYIILFFFILSLITVKFFPRKLIRVFLVMVVFYPTALFSGSKTAALIFTVNFLVVMGILFLQASTVKKMTIVPVAIVLLAMSVVPFMDFIEQQAGQIRRATAVFELLSAEGEVIDASSSTGKSQHVGMDLFYRYPILGVGMANKPMYGGGVEIHNSYIKFLAESGIIGFCAFLLIFLLPMISMLAARDSLIIIGAFCVFYLMFAAMNWPHMLFRQRWVWFFMVFCFIFTRLDRSGNIQKSRLEVFN